MGKLLDNKTARFCDFELKLTAVESFEKNIIDYRYCVADLMEQRTVTSFEQV